MREEFSEDTKERLKNRAGNACSFPGCHIPTSGPSLESAIQTANTGVAAHICSASQGPGARRRLDISKFDRRLLSDYRNGIWMCQLHAKMIDTDEVRYTVEMLNHWRELAELRAHLKQATNSQYPLPLHLRQGNEIPLAKIIRSTTENSHSALATISSAVEDSCIYDVWGKALGMAVRDLACELLKNAFEHGNATKFEIDIGLDRVRIKSDDSPFSFSQLLSHSQGRGGQVAAAGLAEVDHQLITSYRRVDGSNVLEITFITSQEQVLKSNHCSVSFDDFSRGFSRDNELPDIYISCETIYIVIPQGTTFIPSIAFGVVRQLQQLEMTGKKFIFIGSGISDSVVAILKNAFPDIQVKQV
ncbi:hypothetical protein [Erwinia psidii]|uniref:Uncharacterized protein n=1 Tax=Erwinia psidii TaxID=69224 RepID=A0A3N6S3A3_9GAMM|nr:hypothetical protein [Erwinia psidii]MCX8956760.1 hypothetical protein [Erwinia psidii]MCX8960429.1 hypothetical protein [Erwinia psidii]MCX8964388.1 hypothetical protein [Erwinia psidii]RQM40084.1 hypothetical protein EB241_01970 [Erwinia psidii]